jgi:hypothetical protein
MAGHNRSPQQTPREDLRDPEACVLDPYRSFVAAFLRQVVADARRTPRGSGHWTENMDGWTVGCQREAQAFLLDQTRLAAWVELTGADVDKLQERLLRAAGLLKAADRSHDQGDRRRAHPGSVVLPQPPRTPPEGACR